MDHKERRARAASTALFNWMDLPAGDQTALFDRVARAIAASDAAAGYVMVPRERIQAIIKSIEVADPDVLTDTLWMSDCPAETVVDALDAMIEAAISEAGAQEAENARLRDDVLKLHGKHPDQPPIYGSCNRYPYCGCEPGLGVMAIVCSEKSRAALA